MPIIEAMFVTKTDISSACERKKMIAPVMSTLTAPRISGSDAAASEPKTASRIRSTIGKPLASAAARSSLLEVLHPGPQGLLADEVGLDTVLRTVARSYLVAEVGGHVGRLVEVAGDVEDRDRDRRAPDVREGRGLRAVGHLHVGQASRRPVGPVDRGAHVRLLGARALPDHDERASRSGAPEVLDGPVDRLRPEPAPRNPAREVLRLPHGERHGARSSATHAPRISHLRRSRKPVRHPSLTASLLSS